MINANQYYKQLNSNGGFEWERFLRFASNMYSYCFNAMLEIYSSNPNATAVATLKQWNSLGNRIKYGSKAIRVHDKNGVSYQNVFDISQTQFPEVIKKWKFAPIATPIFYSYAETIYKKIQLDNNADIQDNLYTIAFDFLGEDRVPQNVRAFIADSAVYSALLRMGYDTSTLNVDFSNSQEILNNYFDLVGNYYSTLVHFFCNSAQSAINRYTKLCEQDISQNKEISIVREEGAVNSSRIMGAEPVLIQIASIVGRKTPSYFATGENSIPLLDRDYDRYTERLSSLGFIINVENEQRSMEEIQTEVAELTADETTEEQNEADENVVISTSDFENKATDSEVLYDVDVSVISDFKSKTARYFDTTPFGNMSVDDIEAVAKGEVERLFSENNIDAQVERIAIYGSRSRNLNNINSDLDIVVEVRSELKEYALFNILHDEKEPFSIMGINVDLNPIRAEESGTLDTYLQRAEEHLLEQAKNSEGTDRGFINVFRVGDFYEMYGRDALTAAYILGLHISRKNGRDMAGFPQFKYDDFAEILKTAGYEMSKLRETVVELSENTVTDEPKVAAVNTVKNLSQFKRYLKEGMIFEIDAHHKPDWVGERRIITSINTVGFTSKKLDDNGKPNSRDIHMEFGKAGDWKFEENSITAYYANEVLMSFHFVDEAQRENTIENTENDNQDTEQVENEADVPERIYQLITDAHEDGGIDDKSEYATIEEAVTAGRQCITDGYAGFCITNIKKKHIEIVEGDFRLKAAFSSAYLRNDGYTFLAEELDRENEQPFDTAIRYLREYNEKEFGGDEGEELDLSDYSRISIAYTTAEETPDEWINVQVYVDLESFRIVKELDDVVVTEDLYNSVEDMLPALGSLEFDELVAVDDNELRTYYTRKAFDKLDELNQKYSDYYNELYEQRDNVFGYSYALSAGNDYISTSPELLTRFNEMHKDIVSSDREVAALAYALADMGVIFDFREYARQAVRAENRELIDDLEVGDIVTLTNGKWQIDNISGDFSIGFTNTDKTADMSNFSHIGHWKERMLENLGDMLLVVEKSTSEVTKQDRINAIPTKESVSSIRVVDVNAARNYRSFTEQFPMFMRHTYRYMRYDAGEGWDKLSLEWIDRDTFSMMHYYIQNGDLMRDPDIVYRVDRERGEVYPISYENSGLGIYNEYEPNDSRSADANSFTVTWLNNLKHQNYNIERTTQEVNGGEDIECDYSEIPLSFRRYDLHFGLLGNGITVYDVLDIDPITNDYRTIAHISEEGVITYRDSFDKDKAHSFFISQIEEQANKKREQARKEWNDYNSLKKYQLLIERATPDQAAEIIADHSGDDNREKHSVDEVIAKYENSVIFGTEPFPTNVETLSRDELLERVLSDRMGVYEGGNDRIYSYYINNGKDGLESVVKKEYGIGGHSLRDMGEYWFVNYNSSGLTVEHKQSDNDQDYTWAQVTNAIISTIESGNYYSSDNNKDYDRAVNLINSFIRANGGNTRYSDMSAIELARLENTADLPVIAYADLMSERIYKAYNGFIVSETAYEDMSDMVNGIESLDYNELIHLSDEERSRVVALIPITRDTIAVGDKLIYDNTEYTVTSLNGVLPDDVVITEYRDGLDYNSHINIGILAEHARYTFKSSASNMQNTTNIFIPEYNVIVDMRDIDKLVLADNYYNYEGGIDSEGHERKDNYSAAEDKVTVEYTDNYDGFVFPKQIIAHRNNNNSFYDDDIEFESVEELQNKLKEFMDNASHLTIYYDKKNGEREFINYGDNVIDNTAIPEDEQTYDDIGVRYRIENTDSTTYPYNVKVLVRPENSDDYYYAGIGKLVKTREDADDYINNDIKERTKTDEPKPTIEIGSTITVGQQELVVEDIDEVSHKVLLRDDSQAFPIFTEHTFDSINAAVEHQEVKEQYQSLMVDENELSKEKPAPEPKDITIDFRGDKEQLDRIKDYALSLGAVAIMDNANQVLSVSTYDVHIDELIESAAELGIENTVVTDELPEVDADIIYQALTNDEFFNIKIEQIDDFFVGTNDDVQRQEFVKTIFNDDYSQHFLNNDNSQMFGYKTDENGLLIWVGNYLSRTAESRLSWGEVAYQYADLHNNGHLIKAVSNVDNEMQEEISEQDEQENSIPSVQVGDRFRHRLTGETVEVISLEGALPFYTDQCTITRISGRFEVTENINNSDLLNLDNYERLERSPEIQQIVSNNFVITDNDLGVGTPSQRLERNMNAIRLLKRLEQNGEQATPEEQVILSQYVGWGALQEVFDENYDRYSAEREELHKLLTEEEYDAANASVTSAFYTQPTIIKAMYKAIEEFGFKGGSVLEPSMAVGNFFGCLPESIAQNSSLFGVELESVSAGIAKQLYPNADIQNTGYEDMRYHDNKFDIAVGNVPFGNFKVFDTRYNNHNFLIHDYFFAKTIDKVKPNGVIAFITSSGTMDKKSPKTREYISERAKLLGAIRLPNNAFKSNAGTETITDIIFLQKRPVITAEHDDWCYIDYNSDGIAVNSYFLNHPEMICGEMTMRSGRYGDELDVKPFNALTLEMALNNAIRHLPKNIEWKSDIPNTTIEKGENDKVFVEADRSIKIGAYGYVNGEVYFRNDKDTMELVKLSPKKKKDYIKFIRLANATRNIIDIQTRTDDDDEFERARVELNNAYDSFADAGFILGEKGKYDTGWANDVSYELMKTLAEEKDGKYEKTSGLFIGKTIRRNITTTHCDTIEDAYLLSLNNLNRIDFRYISSLTDSTTEDIINTLNGTYMFLDPLNADENDITKGWVTADEYLSGNVREKHRIAVSYAKNDTRFEVNAQNLEKVIPEWIHYDEIAVQLGTSWIPESVIEEFIVDKLDMNRWTARSATVEHDLLTGTWRIANKSIANHFTSTTTIYGTQYMNALHILERTLNLSDAKVYDRVENEEGQMVSVLNKEKTQEACAKQDVIRDMFSDWIYADNDRIEMLENIYNEKFNSERLRTFDGSNLSFDGMNTSIELEPHQKDAVARILYSGNTLIAHVVGAGKTYELAAAAMELKRTGTANKSLFVVPNHLVGQWGKEFLTLYPAANILLADPKSFTPQGRKQFLSKIIHNDYDAIIMAYSTFSQISVSPERRRKFYKDEIDEVIEGLSNAEKGSLTQKVLQTKKKQLETKLKSLEYVKDREDMITFEQLGIDYMFVDEAHNFKNLGINTKLGQVAGINTTASKRSEDMLMKIRYINEINGSERGVVYATGTPISNSIVEMYTMQRYLQPSYLASKGVQHFDSWVGNFGKIQTTVELSPTGTGYRAKKRCASFNNLPELQQMFRRCTDVKTAKMLNLPVPKLKNGQYSVFVTEPSEEQKEYIKECGDRADACHNKLVDPSEDNMLKITNDGKMCALDYRLIDPTAEDRPDSKINIAVENVFRKYNETTSFKGTQVLFLDKSTPNKDKFNLYDDIRDKLVSMGIPREEIAFIHDAKNDTQKLKMFDDVNNGDIRIILGSTEKMGAGTNIQERLCALHHLDVAWRPSDIEQREGRILRKGNTNEEVEIFRYVTKGTFDAYSWQTIENKQKFISQAMVDSLSGRTIDDVDSAALSYAEIKTLAVNDPRIKQQLELTNDVSKLRMLKGQFQKERRILRDKVNKDLPKDIQKYKTMIENFTNEVEYAKKFPKAENPELFNMIVNGKAYSDKKDAGEKIASMVFKASSLSGGSLKIGEYRGFDLEMSYNVFDNGHYLHIHHGKATVTCPMGQSAEGNITRIDNLIDLKLPETLEGAKKNLEKTENDLKIAQTELDKPFAYEQELKEKSTALNKLNSELNFDKEDKEALLMLDDEDEKSRK